MCMQNFQIHLSFEYVEIFEFLSDPQTGYDVSNQRYEISEEQS